MPTESPRPKRIQRQRTKGWRMPPNTVYVGRPTSWGNPYPVSLFGRDLALALFANTARGYWHPTLLLSTASEARYDLAYEGHCAWLQGIGIHPVEAVRMELRGKDLACWCPLDQPCHADVLLELANADD
jgi:hypothetical protein